MREVGSIVVWHSDWNRSVFHLNGTYINFHGWYWLNYSLQYLSLADANASCVIISHLAIPEFKSILHSDWNRNADQMITSCLLYSPTCSSLGWSPSSSSFLPVCCLPLAFAPNNTTNIDIEYSVVRHHLAHAWQTIGRHDAELNANQIKFEHPDESLKYVIREGLGWE